MSPLSRLDNGHAHRARQHHGLRQVRTARGLKQHYQHAARRVARHAATLPEFDRAALGWANAAFETVFHGYQIQINEARKDRSLSDEQRALAVRALKERQRSEAEAARKIIIQEEQQRVDALKARALAIRAADERDEKESPPPRKPHKPRQRPQLTL